MLPYDVRDTNLTRDDRAGYKLDMFVLHETAGRFPGDLNWLTGSGRVSCNWYIRRDGKLYNLDQAGRATAHAGLAAWQGAKKTDGVAGWSWANLCSEGVELEGPNDGTPITTAQSAALLALTRWRVEALKIHPGRLVRHVDISGPHVRTPAEGQKFDPRGLDWPVFLDTLYPHHLHVKAPPRCTLEQFKATLERFDSPALPEAEAIFFGLIQYGIDPAVGIAFFIHESSAGKKGRAVKTRNWGNVRSGMGRELGVEDGFAFYRNWTDSALDFAQRLIEVYGPRWGLYTVERIVPTYAPAFDRNKPEVYINAVRLTVASYQAVNRPPVSTSASIGGPEGKSYGCGRDVREFYDAHGGLLTFGLALADEETFDDSQGERCRALRCENAVIKVKPSMPEGWRIRPMSLAEACAFLDK